MILELTLLGGASYALFRRKPKKKLADVVVLAKAAPLSRVETFKRVFITPFFSDFRQPHQLTLQGELSPLSEAEHHAQTRFYWLTASLAFATLGLTVSPWFYLPSVLPSLVYFVEFCQIAWHSLTVERRFGHEVLTVIFFIGTLGSGMFFELALGGWFYTMSLYSILRTENHSQQSLVNLLGEQPRMVWLLVDGVEVQIPFAQVQMGDTLVVQAGQMIPVDGVIRAGMAAIDQHLLTGEAQAVEKGVGDTVFTGTLVLSGQLQIQVEKTGQQTVAAQVGQILNHTSDFRETLQSRAVSFIDKIALPMVAAVGVTWATLGLSPALGLIAIYPGGRLLSLNPLCMLSSLHVASKKGILIKDGRSLELLRHVDTVVFDKTGTLTLDELQIVQIHGCADLSEEAILRLAAAAEVKQTHPIAQAILTAAAKRNLEIPYIDSAAYKVGFGITVTLDEQFVRVGSERFMAQEAIVLPPEIAQEQTRCHRYGHSLVMVARDNELVGAIELAPMVRPEAQKIVAQLKARQLRVVIISGDHEAPTKHLATSLGIDHYHAAVLPHEKADLVAQLERGGRRVCFVGDGINDTIALKKATSSVSLRGATTIATDTAQIVLMDAHLDQLVNLFELAEAYNHNIDVNLASAAIPCVMYLGGVYFFGWGLLSGILIEEITAIPMIYNVMRPLVEDEGRELSRSRQLL